CSRWGTPFDYW
nr:immunoglobulin heavy chain junction region [Macaca mulatta]MOX59912.1 immunoglobulin heavy chain junction region [Macaca mulatta]MOX60588.1 immunoglobulin heavy chain junction region [Macaca mulatta]MOX65219.1 immunoglobulin heavy chain junction region [Macaca mulatta]MOX67929.1 immunoglobulin heavy chain junction region [Macaca mulatta]